MLPAYQEITKIKNTVLNTAQSLGVQNYYFPETKKLLHLTKE